MKAHLLVVTLEIKKKAALLMMFLLLLVIMEVKEEILYPELW